MARQRRLLDTTTPAAGEPAPVPEDTPADSPRPGLIELPDAPSAAEPETGPGAPPAAATMPEGDPAGDSGGDAGLSLWEVSLSQHSPPAQLVRAATEAEAFAEYKRINGIVATDWPPKVVRIDEASAEPMPAE